MTYLRKRVLEEIELRNYAQATPHAYVSAIRRFAESFHRSSEKLGLEHIREYQFHRIERKTRPRTIALEMSALRFLYNKVLHRRYSRDELREARLLSTADFYRSKSDSRRTVLGERLRFSLGMPF